MDAYLEAASRAARRAVGPSGRGRRHRFHGTRLTPPGRGWYHQPDVSLVFHRDYRIEGERAAVKLSTKGRYGVKALFELALHHGAGPMSLKQIAERQGLSEHYLEQLAAPLRKGGLVTSVRGAQGGYVLGRPPEQITVGDILRCLEGPLEFAEDPEERGDSVWSRVTERLVQVLDSITLADLVDDARASGARQNLMYHI